MGATVTGLRFAQGLRAYFGQTRTGENRAASAALSEAILKIRYSSDAVKVSFSREAKEKAQAAGQGEPAQVQSSRSPGLVKSLLGRLSELTGRMGELRQVLDTETLDSERKLALENEMAGLSLEFQNVTSSRDFQRIIEVTQGVHGNLQVADADSVYRAIGFERGLLGDDFLSLVQNGQLYQLGMLSSGLSQIGGADVIAMASSGAALGNMAETISSAQRALEAPQVRKEEVVNVDPLPAAPGLAPPVPIEAIYAGEGEVALALRTYAPADMIRAAMSGIDLNEVSMLTLVQNPTALEDEADKDALP